MTTQIPPLTIQILNWVVMVTTDLSCVISGAANDQSNHVIKNFRIPHIRLSRNISKPTNSPSSKFYILHFSSAPNFLLFAYFLLVIP